MTFAKYPVTGGGSGSGDVVGPASSVNNALTLFSGTTGKLLKSGGVGSANQILVTDGTTPSWSGDPAVSTLGLKASNNQFTFNDGGPGTTTLNINIGGSDVTLSVPAMSSNSNFIMNRTIQEFEDQMVFKGGLQSVGTLFVSSTLSGNGYNITATVPAASRSYQLPDAGGSADFILSTGTQTIGGTSLTLNPTTLIIPGSITMAANTFARSGAHDLTLTTTAGTNVTLPTTGTLATLGGAETFTGNKVFSGTVELPGTVAYTSAGSIVKGGVGALTLTNASAATLSFAGTGTVTVPTGTYTLAGLSLGNVFTVAQTFTATNNYTSAGAITKSGAGTLTLTNASNAGLTFSGAFTLTVPATGTVDLIGTAQTISAVKTHSAAIAFSGGTAANLSIWAAANVLRQRGGTSGWAVDNTSGNAILSATDAGAFTAGILTGTGFVNNIYGGATNSALSDALRITQLGTGATETGLLFGGRNTSGAVAGYARVSNLIEDSTSGTHSGSFKIYTAVGGVLTEKFIISSAGAHSIGPTAGGVSHVMYASNNTATAHGFVLNSSAALTVDTATNYIAASGRTSDGNDAQIGVRKNAGLNATAYLGLRTADNVQNWMWVDDNDNFRISTNISNIGSENGTFIGGPSMGYETGTFTPGVEGTTLAGVGTYTKQNGHYTRIGNICWVTCFIGWSAHTGTGNIRITGLPFTSRNVTDNFALGTVNANGTYVKPANTAIVGEVDQNSTKIIVQTYSTSGTDLARTALAIDTACTSFGGTFVYTCTF